VCVVVVCARTTNVKVVNLRVDESRGVYVWVPPHTHTCSLENGLPSTPVSVKFTPTDALTLSGERHE
jgi:hypothetical protein